MIAQLLEKLDAMFAKDSGFPDEVLRHWYCGSWYMHICELQDEGRKIERLSDPSVEFPVEGKVVFNPWRCGMFGEEKTDGLIDGLIPAYRIGDEIGLYEVAETHRPSNSYYDGAPWDDGKTVTLRLVRTMLL